MDAQGWVAIGMAVVGGIAIFSAMKQQMVDHEVLDVTRFAALADKLDATNALLKEVRDDVRVIKNGHR